jgi:hypothetical protein
LARVCGGIDVPSNAATAHEQSFRDEWRLPALCRFEHRDIDRRRYHRRSAARNIMIHDPHDL